MMNKRTLLGSILGAAVGGTAPVGRMSPTMPPIPCSPSPPNAAFDPTSPSTPYVSESALRAARMETLRAAGVLNKDFKKAFKEKQRMYSSANVTDIEALRSVSPAIKALWASDRYLDHEFETWM